MDFTGRGSQPAQPAHPANTSAQLGGSAAGGGKKRKEENNKKNKAVRVGAGILGLLILGLVVALIAVISFGGNKNTEANYVDTDRMQAVFLQTGQVYFGKISPDTLKGSSFVLSDIYYLQTSATGSANQQPADTNVSLVKLGCELHAPQDQMVINRDQITFWENLNTDGQVAKAVDTFKKENPNGQKCSDENASTSTTENVQGSSDSATTPSSSTSDDEEN